MATTIKWSQPEDSNWTFSRVYRADSKEGTYNLIASVSIGTYSYSDPDGTSSHWYKISYFDGVNESSLSEPVQAGMTLNYCSLDIFRKLTPFSTNEISDTDVVAIMPIASKMVLAKISTLYKLERDLVGPIDGSNTIFYTKKKPICDNDMDSDVDINDVEVFYATWDDNNRRQFGSAQSVASIDARSGRVTVSIAPTTTTAEAGLFITYRSTVEKLDYSEVRLAANYLLAHFASLKIRGESPNFHTIDTAPYLRLNVAGDIGLPYDSWKYPWLKAALEIIREILGKGTDGIGFARVDAEDAFA